ncbi:MAG: hypothetical protein AAB250_13145, partial [Bdellovibrionota bacterium]
MESTVFKQTRSITKRLRWTVFVIGLFFVLEVAGLYLVSWSSFKSLTHLHEITLTADLSRQAREILYSVTESLEGAGARKGPESIESPKVLIEATDRELQLIRQARANLMLDAESAHELQQAEGMVIQLRSTLLKTDLTPTDRDSARLIANQYALEAIEHMRKVQIRLTQRSELVFKAVNSNRNRPVFVGAFLALIFLSLALAIGLNASKRLRLSLMSLVDATTAVTAGDMDSRAKIIEPD